jgi:hypothetical protein
MAQRSALTTDEETTPIPETTAPIMRIMDNNPDTGDNGAPWVFVAIVRRVRYGIVALITFIILLIKRKEAYKRYTG